MLSHEEPKDSLVCEYLKHVVCSSSVSLLLCCFFLSVILVFVMSVGLHITHSLAQAGPDINKIFHLPVVHCSHITSL